MSPIAAAEMGQREPAAIAGDRLVWNTVVVIVAFVAGVWAQEYVHAREARLAAKAADVKPTPVAKTDWSTFKCGELVALCRTRAKQRLSDVVQ